MKNATSVIVLVLVSFAAGLGASHLWHLWFSPASQTAPAAHFEGRVVEARPFPVATTAVHIVDTATIEAVKRALPNLDKTSEEMGTVILRKAAVVEFEKSARAFREERKKIEEKLRQLPEKEQKLAARRLLDMQIEQAAKLKQIAANSKVQIEAFQELKAVAQ